MSQSTVERALFLLLLIAFLIVGALFAVRTPRWQVPDEPAHYNYVAQVSANGCCPVLAPGDWNSAYLDQLKAARFAPDLLGNFASIQYEDHQPPLYYLLESVVFRLTSGSLIALRLFSVLLGAGVIAGAYATVKALLPDQPQIALGTMALVAFIPQHIAMLSAVENDALAELIVAVTLWLTVVYLKTERVRTWQLGILVGLGFLTKLSTIFLVGIVPLAILLKWWIHRRENVGAQRATPLRALIAFALPVLILGGIWIAHDLNVYGFPDIFGLGEHNRVVVGQLRTADYIAQIGVGQYLQNGLALTFQSFWGMFGWMAFGLPNWAYWALLILLVVALIGWLIARARPLPLEPQRSAQRAAWFILGLTAVLAVLQYFYYNTEFVQFQARYMYPGLIPFGLGIALGVDGWRRLIFTDRRGVVMWITPCIIALLIPLDLYAIWRIIPGLAP